MQQLRLIGLVLFITTVFLAMAAAATQTTHIRFNQPPRDANGNAIPVWQSSEPQRFGDQGSDVLASPDAVNPSGESPLQFTAVPVLYPLVIAGGIGLLMWFVPAPLTAHRPVRKNRKSMSRRRR